MAGDSTREASDRPVATDPAYSLGTLLFICQAPLIVFAIGMTVVTMVVVIAVANESHAITSSLEMSGPQRDAVVALGESFRNIWLASMAGFYVALVFAALVVSYSHRILRGRIDRIATFAEEIGKGGKPAGLDIVTDDALGHLSGSLARVERELATRNAMRGSEVDLREQLGRIQRAMGWIDSEEDARRVVGRAFFALVRGTPAELLLADGDGRSLVMAAESSTAPRPQCGVVSPAKCPAIQRGSPLVFPDSESLDACPQLDGREPACSALCVPVLVMGRATGVLHLTRPRGETFEEPTVDALESLTGAFGMRMGTLRALGTARLQAETDALTGLLNRRSLEEKATQVLAASQRVVVAMADLDHFKRLNDTHGHAAGDRALRDFAQILKKTLRPGDIVARYGGEEFSVLLPNATLDEGVGALDRVRVALARHCATAGAPPSATVSFGVAEFPRHGTDLDTLLKAADGALYRSKQDGRDRVSAAE